MLALILTVCVIAEPSDCAVERILFTDLTLMQCTAHAPEIAAQWVGDHPGLRVMRMRCAPAGREFEPA